MSVEFAPCAYRFKSRTVDFVTVGRLEKAEGVLVLHVTVPKDSAYLLQQAAKAGEQACIYAEVRDEIVAVMRMGNIGAKMEADGARVHLWVMLGPLL